MLFLLLDRTSWEFPFQTPQPHRSIAYDLAHRYGEGNARKVFCQRPGERGEN